MLEIIGLALLLLAAGGWLLNLLAKWPDAAFRVMTMGIGLLLAVGMTIGGIVMLLEPEADTGEGLLFLPWVAAGVVLIVKAVKNRWLVMIAVITTTEEDVLQE